MVFKLNKNSKISPFDRLKEAENLPGSRKEEFKGYVREYIQSDNWKVRNVGVKLIGMLGFEEMVPDLVRMLTDRTPDKLINRILGGDFYQVGFIRRNCIRSLILLGKPSKDIKEAVLKALGDPYWEVRAETVYAIPKLLLRDDLKDAEKKLIELLNDRKFEVVVQSIATLGSISMDKKILNHLRKLYLHPNFKIKGVLIKALHNLYNRGIISSKEELTSECNKIFIPTSNY